MPFERKYWYWGFFFILRQVFLNLISVYSEVIQEQALVTILLCCVCVYAQAAYRPFLYDIVNRIELFGLLTSFFTFYLGTFLSFQTDHVTSQALSVSIFILNIGFVFTAVVAFLYFKFNKTNSASASTTGDITKVGSVVAPIVSPDEVEEALSAARIAAERRQKELEK